MKNRVYLSCSARTVSVGGFISTIAVVIPAYAISLVLIMVGIFMIQSLRYLDFET